MKRTSVILLALLLMLTIVAMAACASKQAPGSSGAAAPGSQETTAASSSEGGVRDSLVIALQGDPTTLDAQYPDDGNMQAISYNIYGFLFEIDGGTLEAVPSMAVDIQSIDDVTWELKIREGVKFHDGTLFTAEDAVFSINRILDPDYNSQILSDFNAMKEAVLVDDSTFRIITHAADPLVSKRLTKLPMLSKAFTESHTEDELTIVANGTGPYKFVEWKRGVHIKIERNDDFWGPAPSIKTVYYRTLEEPMTRLSALKAGEIDLAVNMYPEFTAELPKVFSEEGYETYWVRFDQTGIFSDVRLRMAANYAIDLDAIADNLFLGYATPCQGQFGKKGFFGYNESIKGYGYDLEKAKALIAEAGYNGEVIEFVSERGRWLKDGEITEAIAAMLVEAGFNIQVKIVGWNEWLDTLFDPDKTPTLQFSASSNEWFDMDRTYSALVHSTGTQARVYNSEYDALIEAAASELDVAKREKLYWDLADLLHEDPFAIYLLSMSDLYGGAADLVWTPRRDSKIIVSEMSFAS